MSWAARTRGQQGSRWGPDSGQQERRVRRVHTLLTPKVLNLGYTSASARELVQLEEVQTSPAQETESAGPERAPGMCRTLFWKTY